MIDIILAIGADYDIPVAVDLSELEDEELAADHKDIPAYTRSLGTQIGPCYFTDSRDTGNGCWARMHVRYNRECDARRAMCRLNNKAPPFLGGGALSVRIQDSATLKISTQLCHRIKSALEMIKEQFMEQHMAWYNVREDVASAGRFTIIKVRGHTGGTDLAAAMDMIIAIVEGTLVRDRDQTFWSPDLASPSAADKNLHAIEQDLGILFQRDVAKRELRWHGPPHLRRSVVQQAVLTALRKNESPARTIELTLEGFAWACRGGMTRLLQAAAPDTVSLDVLAKRVLVHGSARSHRLVMAVLNVNDADSTPLLKHAVSADCTICITDAIDPITTECGHIYCQECFTNLCSSVNTTSVDFSITCKGNSDWCQIPLSLGFIQDHIPPSAFSEALESLFNAYIRRRPNEFRSCPSPDCGYVYRLPSEPPASDTDSIVTCARCVQPICYSCGSVHCPKHCAEHQDNQQFEQYKQQNRHRVKDCPKCRSVIEKIDGCNHITCDCGAHLCWVCLAAFEQEGEYYDHLRVVHGGSGGEEDEE